MAVRDQSQKAKFLYANVYQLYKKSQDAQSMIDSSARVFRADDLAKVSVTDYQPPRFEPKKRAPIATADAQSVAANAGAVNPFEDLKGNLQKLQDMHTKLRFMLKELEDLVKKS